MGLCKDQTRDEIAILLRERPASERKDILSAAGKLVREPTIQEIRVTQASRLIVLGFNKALGMSEDEFIAAIPLPKEGKTGHVPIINPKYISIPTAMSLIEVSGQHGKNYLNLDLLEDLKEAKVPQGMFSWRYGLDYETCRGKSPADSLKLILKANRLPGTANEAIYVAAQMPEVLKKIYLDCPGSRYGREGVPDLDLYDDGPGLGARYADCGGSSFGSFSFGE